MSDIFISYSSRDRAQALSLVEWLEMLGHSVWIDRTGIHGAQNWTAEIVAGLNDSAILILLLSEHSVGSHNVAREIQLAVEKGKHILPVVIEEVVLPIIFEYPLAGLQRVAFDDRPAIQRALTRLSHQEHASATPMFSAQPGVVRDPSKKRVAVLPFEDLSPGRDHDWFSDGLTDELIGTLSKLSKVYCCDRQSVRVYKNTTLKTKQIAEELDVRYIITGDVRKAGDRVRIGAQLVDTDTGQMLWGDKYTGTMDDIFEIQETVATKMTEGLRLALTPEEKRELTERDTENVEAYELTLQARSYMNRNTKQDFLHAVGLLEEAIRLDKNYASAYHELVIIYLRLYRIYDRVETWLEKAEQAVDRAQELQPDSVIGHIVLAELLDYRGREQEAKDAVDTALKLGVEDPMHYLRLGFVYLNLKMHTEAALMYENFLVFHPDHLTTHYNLALQYTRLGDEENRMKAIERGLPYFRKYVIRQPDNQAIRTFYSTLLYLGGRYDEAIAEMESLLRLSGVDAGTYYNCACTFLRLGKQERSLELLEQALDAGYANKENFLVNDPDLIPFHDTEQWRRIQEKLNRL